MGTIFCGKIPEYVVTICQTLHVAGHSAYVVGGATRDLALGFTPKDFDVATSAVPAEVEKLFPETVPTGKQYGTITVLSEGEEPVEVTTYRNDAEYSDGRRPDRVTYSTHITADLARRDFTVNAIAYDPLTDTVADPFTGLRDAEANLLQTVGDAAERISEDALRMLRAVRIKAEKGFRMADSLRTAIQEHARLINRVSQERIRTELCRIITSPRSTEGVYDLQELGLLQEIIPELAACVGVKQRQDYHKYDVFGHIAHALQYAGSDPVVRLAVLLHDIGKPATASVDAKGVTHFYGHEIKSAQLAEPILERLKFSNQMKSQTLLLIREHMRNIDSDRSLRQLMSVLRTREQAYRFAQIRFADKMAGRSKPTALNENYHRTLARIERILQENAPLQVTDLAINGRDVQEFLHLSASPEVGRILEQLLRTVIDKPALNKRETLLKLLPEVAEDLQNRVERHT